MKSYENLATLLSTIACFIFAVITLIIIVILPDYYNAQKCTCSAYATVTDIDESTIPYTITLHGNDMNPDGIIQVRTYNKSLRVGDYILVEYTEDRTHFRIPNSIY